MYQLLSRHASAMATSTYILTSNPHCSVRLFQTDRFFVSPPDKPRKYVFPPCRHREDSTTGTSQRGGVCSTNGRMLCPSAVRVSAPYQMSIAIERRSRLLRTGVVQSWAGWGWFVYTTARDLTAARPESSQPIPTVLIQTDSIGVHR